MSLLSERSLSKEDKSNIITLGAIAKEEKLKDKSVVNATIGMLYDEDGKLFTFKSVDKALNLLTGDEKYAYASTPGSPKFHEMTMNYSRITHVLWQHLVDLVHFLIHLQITLMLMIRFYFQIICGVIISK